MDGTAPIPELQRRVIYALLQPVVALCRRFHVPLDVIEGLTRLAYYEELRRRGNATQSQVAEVFGTSLRTVVGVERRFRTDFLTPEYEMELARRLEEALGAGPRGSDELAAELAAAGAGVARSLASLAGTGRVIASGSNGDEHFALSGRFQSLVRDDLLGRIDGLRHQLEVLTAAVTARFLGDGDERPSVARTLAFLGRPEDVQTMIDELVRALRLRAIDVEERALEGGPRERYGVTMAIAPIDEREAAD